MPNSWRQLPGKAHEYLIKGGRPKSKGDLWPDITLTASRKREFLTVSVFRLAKNILHNQTASFHDLDERYHYP